MGVQKTVSWGKVCGTGVGAIIIICGLTAVQASAGPSSTDQEQIIWNEPQGGEAAPAPAAPPVPATNSGSPIRDNFASSAPSAPPTGKGGIIWDQPSSKSTPSSFPSSTAVSSKAGPCREFQQQVMIDGRPQKAHGRACRQPDGSWRIVN